MPGKYILHFSTPLNRRCRRIVHCKKKVGDFPPRRDVTKQTLPGREQKNLSRPGRVWLVTSRLGMGKSLTFFYSVCMKARTIKLALQRVHKTKLLTVNKHTASFFQESTITNGKGFLRSQFFPVLRLVPLGVQA